MKRVLVQVLYSGPGGLGTFWKYAVSGDTEGKFVHRALFFGDCALHEEYESFCLTRQIEYRHINNSGMSLRDRDVHIRTALTELKPDIVLLHQPILILSVAGFCKTRRIPLFTFQHTTAGKRRTADFITSVLSTILSRKMIVFYEQQIAETVGILRMFLKHKFFVLKKGIDIHYFRPGKKAENGGKIRICMQGRLDASKDYTTLIKAAALAAKTESGFELTIAGTGERERELKDAVEKTKTQDLINFAGWVSGEAHRQLLADTDIYIHSSFGETVCYAIMEAQSSGCAIIASNVSGVNAVLAHEENALLFPQGATNMAAAHIVRLTKEKKFREHLAAVSRKEAENLYSHTKVFDTLNLMITAE